MAQSPELGPVRGQEFVDTPISVTTQGIRLGQALDQVVTVVSGSGNWTLWLDANVDPNQLMDLNQAGPTAAAAILTLVSEAKLAAFPLPGVLLVGRPSWIDDTLNAVLSAPPSSGPYNPNDLITIRWPAGTTAAEVLELVLLAPGSRAESNQKTVDDAQFATRESLSLTSQTQDNAVTTQTKKGGFDWVPHDIWPAGRMIQSHRGLAATLVLARLNLAMKPGSDMKRLQHQTRKGSQPTLPSTVRLLSPSTTDATQTNRTVPTAAGGQLSALYPNVGKLAELRSTLLAVDRRCAVRSQGRRVRVTGTAAAHRTALSYVWKQPAAPPNAGGQKPGRAKPAATYDLQVVNKPAGAVLRQFATAAGRKLTITPSAQLRSEQLISLDGKTKTLEELSEMVAAAAGLQLDWGDKEVVVSKAE